MKTLFKTVLGLVIIFIAVMMAIGSIKGREYVRGSTGKYCYPATSFPKTVTTPVYYGSLSACKESLAY